MQRSGLHQFVQLTNNLELSWGNKGNVVTLDYSVFFRVSPLMTLCYKKSLVVTSETASGSV